MVPRDDQIRLHPQLRAALGHHFRGLDLHIHSARAPLNGKMQNRNLLFNAAVKTPVVLMAATGSEDGTPGMLFQKLRNCLRAGSGVGKIIEPEFEEVFTRLGFAPSLFEEARDIRQAERYAYTGKRTLLRHLVHQNNR